MNARHRYSLLLVLLVPLSGCLLSRGASSTPSSDTGVASPDTVADTALGDTTQSDADRPDTASPDTSRPDSGDFQLRFTHEQPPNGWFLSADAALTLQATSPIESLDVRSDDTGVTASDLQIDGTTATLSLRLPPETEGKTITVRVEAASEAGESAEAETTYRWDGTPPKITSPTSIRGQLIREDGSTLELKFNEELYSAGDSTPVATFTDEGGTTRQVTLNDVDSTSGSDTLRIDLPSSLQDADRFTLTLEELIDRAGHPPARPSTQVLRGWRRASPLQTAERYLLHGARPLLISGGVEPYLATGICSAQDDDGDCKTPALGLFTTLSGYGSWTGTGNIALPPRRRTYGMWDGISGSKARLAHWHYKDGTNAVRVFSTDATSDRWTETRTFAVTSGWDLRSLDFSRSPGEIRGLLTWAEYKIGQPRRLRFESYHFDRENSNGHSLPLFKKTLRHAANAFLDDTHAVVAYTDRNGLHLKLVPPSSPTPKDISLPLQGGTTRLRGHVQLARGDTAGTLWLKAETSNGSTRLVARLSSSHGRSGLQIDNQWSIPAGTDTRASIAAVGAEGALVATNHTASTPRLVLEFRSPRTSATFPDIPLPPDVSALVGSPAILLQVDTVLVASQVETSAGTQRVEIWQMPMPGR